MKTIRFIVLLNISIVLMAQDVQKPSCGRIERIESFSSHYVSSRNIDIWIPDHYDGTRKFSVLYMHDGQMLYDSSITWNKQSWDVDDVLCELYAKRIIKNVIVVGIWNVDGERHADYFPQKPFEALSLHEKEIIREQLKEAGRSGELFRPRSDAYLRFLVEELKPYIDKKYQVHSNRKNTFIMGSSMGGLISLYALCEYPDVFGSAACLSTHWPGTFSASNPFPEAMRTYLEESLPAPGSHKIYFDYGDQTLDALYPPLQNEVDKVMKNKAYSEKNWKTLFFEGKDHSETAWSERLDTPLIFLLGKE